MKFTCTSLTLFGLLSLFVTSAVSQTVYLAKNVYAPGEKIVVTYSGLPGNNRDWISLAQAGSSDEKYLAWAYTEGRQSGTMEFAGLPSGDYEVRGYYHNEPSPRARLSFRVGNTDQNVSAKTTQSSYKTYEKINVQFSGLPGNSKDWIGLAPRGSADDKYVHWAYTDGKQSGTMEFPGLADGDYEVRAYFNGEGTVRFRYPFVVGRAAGGGTKLCRTELSIFYAGMNALGLSWGRLGSDAFVPAMIANVQLTLNNVVTALQQVPCLDFDANKIRSYSSRLPQMNRVQAVNEIDQLIKEIQGSLGRANIACDNGTFLQSLFVAAVHMGASQGIANTFVCMTIPADWQGNLRNHLGLVTSSLASFNACLPGFNTSVISTVPLGAPNAYETVSTIIGINMQVLWSVSLSNCCCYCR